MPSVERGGIDLEEQSLGTYLALGRLIGSHAPLSAGLVFEIHEGSSVAWCADDPSEPEGLSELSHTGLPRILNPTRTAILPPESIVGDPD